ncbi:MAG TPA: hypothetical protein PKZ76_03260 [Xanthomonadaceae bacterium]|nr:hypothetical protein [Xanthomonadaceae bacterium]
MDSVSPYLRHAAPWLLLGGMVLLVWGVLTSSLLDALPVARAQEQMRLALLALLPAAAVVAWRRWRLANALALVLIVAHVAATGPMALLGTLLLVAAALALGDGIARRARAGSQLALLIGLALIAAGVAWLLPLKVHRDWIYALALVTIVVTRHAVLARQWRELRRHWRFAVAASPRMAALAVLALGLASTSTWLPTLQFDDLAYHLGLPAQLQSLGYYRMDPASQVWALAPWAGDVLHGVAQVLIGAEARGSVNLVWLAASAWLLAALCRSIGLPPTMAWLAVTLYASLPMTAMLMGGMQTEGPGTAVLLGLAPLIQRAERGPRERVLMAAAALAGFLLALKASFGVPLLLMGAWLLWQWRGRVPWPALPGALALGVLVGGSSYAYAWWLSGNPVLPLFNAVFASPYFPEWNFSDPRYTGTFGAAMLWRLVFESDRTMEGWPGIGGFQLIGLALVLPLALLRPRSRALLIVAASMCVALLVMAQYLRYAHPAMVLLLAPMLAGLHAVAWRRVALVCAVGLAAFNFAYQANASWILRLGSVDMLIAAGADPDPLLERFAPERLLVRDLPRHARVLVAGRPYTAELAGRGFSATWYDQELQAAAMALARTKDEQHLRTFLREYGFTHVLIGGKSFPPGLGAGLDAIGARRVGQHYDAVLWELTELGPEPRRDLSRERDLATRMRRAWR